MLVPEDKSHNPDYPVCDKDNEVHQSKVATEWKSRLLKPQIAGAQGLCIASQYVLGRKFLPDSKYVSQTYPMHDAKLSPKGNVTGAQVYGRAKTISTV